MSSTPAPSPTADLSVEEATLAELSEVLASLDRLLVRAVLLVARAQELDAAEQVVDTTIDLWLSVSGRQARVDRNLCCVPARSWR